MSIRKYVHQVKPIQENNRTPHDVLQNFFLTEAKTASTYMEGVIAECSTLYGKYKNNRKQFDKLIFNQDFTI